MQNRNEYPALRSKRKSYPCEPPFVFDLMMILGQDGCPFSPLMKAHAINVPPEQAEFRGIINFDKIVFTIKFQCLAKFPPYPFRSAYLAIKPVFRQVTGDFP